MFLKRIETISVILIIKWITVALLSDCLVISSANTSQQKREVNLRESVLRSLSKTFGLHAFRHSALISLLLHENMKTIGLNS